MASFATLNALNGSLLRSQFLGQDHHNLMKHHNTCSTSHHTKPSLELLQPHAKFNIEEILGGRGICNGEMGIQKELEKKVEMQPQQQKHQESVAGGGKDEENSIDEDAFEKEMMGLTGGFPGGEKGLLKFIQENPPEKPATVVSEPLNLEEAKAMLKK